MSADEQIAHELAILRPKPGDVLVLYLAKEDDHGSNQKLLEAFELATRARGYITLACRAEHGTHVQHWPEAAARATYEILRKRFEKR